MTPAEELRAAVERLEELAVKATPGPWRAASETGPCAVFGPDRRDRDVVEVEFEGGGVTRGADAAWIAAMSPQVAAPLVAWLRQAAEMREVIEQGHESNRRTMIRLNGWCSDSMNAQPAIAPATARALAFARLINGTAS